MVHAGQQEERSDSPPNAAEHSVSCRFAVLAPKLETPSSRRSERVNDV